MAPKNEVVAAAAHFLKNGPYKDQADSVVVLPDTAVEFTYGWTVAFDLKEHMETGDFTKKPFSPVLVVPHDGSAVHFAPTYLPTHEYMKMRASGEWPPKKGL
ncbi:YrhB domain-containing protein [Streptomyces mexicanus]|jgi:hypothetical protein|uniref:Serine protease n=1 Tax=Streptomyces mexicanus TaxID=178566 RepID=A0A7X1LP01_9ACTN|nr:YrhB domain-containing protein [Streptomyces mexicanus]MBC2864069.1 serine protease [Streptomyces mexicanus]